MKKIIYIIVLFTLSNLLFATKTFAYIDPGSGSILLQAIIATIVGAGTTISIYWNKIKLFFTKILKKKNNDKR